MCEEQTISLVDVLEEDEELEEEASAVLAGSDSDHCSYPQGYVKRQALYACSTCTPKDGEAAGVCLACSYKCHEGHDLFELYTKRNFRCDCGNTKFAELQCKLYPDKDEVNSLNKYSHNFFGVYCTCGRPYPDPDDQVEDQMIQCVVCEDWLHGRHLGCVVPDSVELQEMICESCMNKNSFLWTYAAHLAAPACPQEHLSAAGLSFLLDESDTVLAYEKKGKSNEHEQQGQDPLMLALDNLNRVQQLEIIHGYNDMKTELKDFLQRFAAEGKVVTPEDIRQFFEQQQSRKRRRVDAGHFYCT
uniref:Putative E3 ubiquitin-protein ligase UBR7 n=1 Tax=Mastacembelus armatus TaxID=205130 RepID=A0A7N8WT32_9TELE